MYYIYNILCNNPFVVNTKHRSELQTISETQDHLENNSSHFYLKWNPVPK